MSAKFQRTELGIDKRKKQTEQENKTKKGKHRSNSEELGDQKCLHIAYCPKIISMRDRINWPLGGQKWLRIPSSIHLGCPGGFAVSVLMALCKMVVAVEVISHSIWDVGSLEPLCLGSWLKALEGLKLPKEVSGVVTADSASFIV